MLGVCVKREACGVMYYQYQPSSRNLRTVNIPVQNPTSVGVQLFPDELWSFRISCHVRVSLSACLGHAGRRQRTNQLKRAHEAIGLKILSEPAVYVVGRETLGLFVGGREGS